MVQVRVSEEELRSRLSERETEQSEQVNRIHSQVQQFMDKCKKNFNECKLQYDAEICSNNHSISMLTVSQFIT